MPLFTLNNPSAVANDLFGSSVAISGTQVVVGAHADDTGASNAGSAYVYDLVGAPATPLPAHTLNNPGPAATDFFGYSVAIAGSRVVVGANGDETGAADTGSAYVYDVSSGTPTEPVTTLNNPTRQSSDLFATTVAVSGTRVVVGAYSDNTAATDAGSAYVYDVSSGTPTVPVATLNNPGPAASDNFGHSVAVSGTRVVVGAYRDDTGDADAGSAYVYDLAGATPTVPTVTLNNPTPSASANFGISVAISGSARGGGCVDDTGRMTSVYVYDLSGGTPAVPILTLNSPGPTANDRFGVSVAISGTRVVGRRLSGRHGRDQRRPRLCL